MPGAISLRPPDAGGGVGVVVVVDVVVGGGGSGVVVAGPSSAPATGVAASAIARMAPAKAHATHEAIATPRFAGGFTAPV
jgi:hypothetical protein